MSIKSIIKTTLKIAAIITGGVLAALIPITIPIMAIVVPVLCELIDAIGNNEHNVLTHDEAIQTDMDYQGDHDTLVVIGDSDMDLEIL